MAITNESDVYYDPYDFDIDIDPHPVWKRLRNEAPLYYNEKYDFFALSRHDDLARVLNDRDTFISGKGNVFNIINQNIEVPPGLFIAEDEPQHPMHRAIVSRLF